MYLSRLDIQGFKSFASGVSLQFRPGMTSVVGPNGSGKSNVAESIRWALGEQSLKALRGKRSDDVIFAGSDKKSRLGVAEVSLYLNNDDQRAGIPYSELVLTRRVYRDGEGEYLINHQPARLQDIQLLLAQANFGQRSYSVIGQGMIDSFLLSSSQERKHLFDEAAGVRQYQLKKDQAVHKLSVAKENLFQGEAVMAEIEPRLRSLTRQVRRLERREGVEKELRDKQRLYYGLLWQAIDHERAELDTQFKEREKNRQSIEHELAAIQQELEGIEKERTTSEMFAEMQRRYNTILDDKNRQLQEQTVLKGKLEVAFKEAGRGEVVYHRQRLEELKNLLNRLQEEIDVTNQVIDRAGQSVERESKALQKLDERWKKLETQLQAAFGSLPDGRGLQHVQQSVEDFAKKYRAFVAFIKTSDAMVEARQRAASLEQELGIVVRRVSEAGAGIRPEELLTIQRDFMEATKERQHLAERVNEAAAELQRATDQRQRLQEEQVRHQEEFKKIQQESSIQELAKTNPQQAYAAYADQVKDADAEVAKLDGRLKAVRQEMNDFNALETQKKDRLFTLQKSFRDSQAQLNHAANAVNDIRVELAKVDQRREDLQHEIGERITGDGLELVKAAAKSKLGGDTAVLAEELGALNRQLQLIGGIDEQITSEYQETNERWEFLNKQAVDLRSAIDQLEKAITDLDGTIKKRFDSAFKKINEAFHKYFRTLFNGGKAELVLVQEVLRPELPDDEEGDVEEKLEVPAKSGEKVVTGIDIKATPPGKKLQSVAMLSGGERALTSIALLCAIISNNPSPFVVLDEVDAALDEANSQRFAAILEHLAGKTQFITITHNRATMEKSQVLYGVTMGDDGVSQLLSVKMEEVEKIIQAHGNR